MANFYMMVGLPGSGKTTFAHNIEKGAMVISSDIIRKELWGSEETQGDNKIVFQELEYRVIQNLMMDKSVVYDATNINAKKRKEFLKKLNKVPNVKKVCMLMSVPYEQCLQKNEERDRVVPEDVIARMYINFQIPQSREGWDEINIIQPKLEDYDAFKEMDKLCQIKLNKKKGNLTIGEHCVKAVDYIVDKYSLSLPIEHLTKLQLAAFLHDIGEDFSVDNKELQRNHYENVSAYKSLLYLVKDKSIKTVEDILYVADLIQLQAEPYFIKNEEEKQKLIDKIGEEEYNDLMLLHESDMAAR